MKFSRSIFSKGSSALVAAFIALPACHESAPTSDEGATVGQTSALTTTRPGKSRAYAFESQIDGISPLGDICVLYLYDEGEYIGLVVDQDQDDPPLCGPLQSYLASDYGLLEWDTADATPITDLNALQNLAVAFDQQTGRNVDYFSFDGTLREYLWGAVYGNGLTLSAPSLGGDVCTLIVETDAGDTVGLVERVDGQGQCPLVGPFQDDFFTIQVPADETTEIVSSSALLELGAGYPNMLIEWRTVSAPVRLLFSGAAGGTFDGVAFSDEQAIATLELVNNVSFDFLDDDVPLNVIAVNSIVNARPVTSMSDLAALYWVGPSALTHLRNFECPAGSIFDTDGCVADPNPLLPFGGDCSGQGGSACQSGLCTTSWDGYFCYYTACTATCNTVQDCENIAIAAGFSPQEVQGSLWCGNGICDLTYLEAGGEVCE